MAKPTVPVSLVNMIREVNLTEPSDPDLFWKTPFRWHVTPLKGSPTDSWEFSGTMADLMTTFVKRHGAIEKVTSPLDSPAQFYITCLVPLPSTPVQRQSMEFHVQRLPYQPPTWKPVIPSLLNDRTFWEENQ